MENWTKQVNRSTMSQPIFIIWPPGSSYFVYYSCIIKLILIFKIKHITHTNLVRFLTSNNLTRRISKANKDIITTSMTM